MRLPPIAIAIAIAAAPASAARADFLLGGQVGAGPLRMGELEDFWDEIDFHHDTDPLAFYWQLSATWQFAERHALLVSVERITTSITFYDAYLPFGFLWSEQNFETLPVSLGYEFALVRSQRGAATWLGLGGGFYMTELEGNGVLYYDDPSLDNIQNYVREGEGYGFHGYLRQTAPIADRLSLTGMIRGRWADGTAFDDDDESLAVDFTGLDVDLGLEWQF